MLFAGLLGAILTVLSLGQPVLTPTATAEALPAASLRCVSAVGATTPAEVQRGVCTLPTGRVPAEAWLAFTLSPGAEPAMLVASDVYTLKQGALEVHVEGQPALAVRAWDAASERPVYDGRLMLPLPRHPDRPTPVLLRMALQDQRQLAHPERQILLLSQAGAGREQASRWFGLGSFTGLMLIMALYHAFLWRAERLTAAAWYSLALVSIAFYFAGSHNLFALLPFPGSARLSLLLHPGEGPLFACCYIQFIRRYANLSPWGDRATRLIVGAFAVTTVVAPIIHFAYSISVAATVVNVLGVLSGVTTLTAAGVSAYRGDTAARILAWSTLGPFFGVLVQIGSMTGLFPAHGWPTAALQVGVTAQVVLLGLALSDRIRRLRVDRDQAEAIVRLTLPDVIAERLKQGRKSIADRHDQVAVLFADLAGFTPLSASHSPESIVRLLDALFSEMDALAHQVGAEKIKTIGDCYMVAAGAPSPHPDPVAALAELALALPQAAERALARVRSADPSLPTELPLRVGLHVGPVVAGVLGQQKLAYDLWGDTVNTASRMESHGVIGRIQCTEQVVRSLGERYQFESRGEIAVRGKGALAVWFLLSRKGALTAAS